MRTQVVPVFKVHMWMDIWVSRTALQQICKLAYHVMDEIKHGELLSAGEALYPTVSKGPGGNGI